MSDGRRPVHVAHRDDDVATWIKRHRDREPRYTAPWYALDDLLDDYRLHADTGQPLFVAVNDGGVEFE